MLHQGYFAAGNVVKGGWMLQNSEVTGFLDVCTHCAHKPQRVIVESTADVIVAALGQGLVLVICGAVGKLDGCNINDAFSCPVGDYMHEAV